MLRRPAFFCFWRSCGLGVFVRELVYDGETDELQKASTPLIPVKAHGSGDIFTAVLTGMWLRGLSPRECAQKAATFTTQALQYTVDHADSLRDGLLFEALMKELVNL